MESFLRPFFGGVLLDNELTTSASLFQYYFQKFIRGRTLLPSRGIREIPLQIASHLPASCIKLNSTVAKIGSNHVELRDGGKIAAEHIVLATPAPETARLLERNPPAPPRRVSVCYFTSPEALYEEKLLVLPRGKDRLVRHYAQVTNVAPKLAPRGSHLLSATILDRRSLEDVRLLQHAKAEIAESFPSAQTLLTPLRVIDVPYGVPAQLPRYSLQRESGSLPTNVSLAGDHTTHGSIQGALQSGEEAAQSILKRL
jgi:protoporphyrinogen oxidase